MELPSGAVKLSGTVYDDTDYSWAMDSGEPGLAGVTVMATGYTFGADGIDNGGAGDDQAVTAADAMRATTNASGQYVLDGLAPGSWTVSVDGSAASIADLVPAETQSSVTVQATEEATGLNLGYMVRVPAPVLVDDSVRVSAGDTVTVSVLGNDTIDASGAITAVGTASAGTASWTEGDSTVDYTAAANGSGDATFTYTVTDKARQSATATVTVTVVPLPTATDQSVTIAQSATPIDLTGKFTGDGAVLTTGTAGNGSVAVSGAVVTYTPAAGFSGSDSFTYTVTDSMGKTAQATVSVTVLQAPDLADDSATTTVAKAATVKVTENDPFVGTGTLAVATQPGNGTAAVSGSDVVYTPAAGFVGTDTFTYSVTDSVGQSDTATVTVIVAEAIALTDDAATTGEGMPATVDVLANDTATAGVITEVTNGSIGTAVITDGKVVYTPSGHGTDVITYTVKDSIGATATAKVTITVLQKPDLADDSTTTTVAKPVSVAVTGNDPFVGTGTLAVATQPTHGTATVDGANVVYTPAAGWTGTDTFTYSVTDVMGQTDTATVTVIVVEGISLLDDAATTGEATPVTIDVLGNDTATGGVITAVTNGTIGTAVITDGKVVYTPTGIGTDTFTYTVQDNSGATDTATVTVTVLQKPEVADDAVSTLLNTAVTVKVTDNDPFVGTGTLAVATQGGNGTASVDGSTIVYTPAAGFLGTDSFTYSVTDSVGQSDTATVTVTVVESIGLSDDAATTGEGMAVTIDVLANDVATGGTITEVTAGSIGTAIITDGKVVYTPTGIGTDTFTYTVKDSSGVTATANVTVIVLQKPDLSDDTATVLKDQATTLTVTANDAFVGTGAMTVSTPAGNGEAVVNGTAVVYTPAAGFLGTDSFTYTVTDSVGQTSTATVTVYVVEGIALTADTARTGEDTAVTIDVLANDVATEGTITSTTQGADGTVAVVDGQIVYTPAAGFAGTDTFTYTVTDLAGNTATANVTVTVVARPVSEAIALRTGLDTPVQVDAAARVTGDALTVAVTTAPESGELTIVDGVLTFTPVAGFVGNVSATLTWTDSVGQTVTQDITVEVVDAPVANDDWAETTLDTPVTVDLFANDQGDALTIAVDSPENGTATVDADGVLTFTPAAGWSGSAVFGYTVTDSVGQTATASVQVDVYAPPAAPDLTARTGVGMEVVFEPIAPAARSLTASPVTVTAVGTTDAGEAVLNEDGTITFTPAATFVGTTSFTYTVTDHLGQSTEGTIEVTVIALTATGEVNVDTAHDAEVTIDVLGQVEGSSPTIVSVGTPAHGTVSVVDGKLVYIPAAGWAGVDSFTVEVQDDLGQTITLTVNVTTAAAPGVDDPEGGPDTGDGPGGNWLARTGSAWSGLLALALAAIAGGLVLLIRSRREESTKA